MKNSSAKSTAQNNLPISVSTESYVILDVVKPKASTKSDKQNLENAVYSYIQTIRTLGRTTTSTYDIAKALSLPNHVVVGIVQKLRDKGVYPAA